MNHLKHILFASALVASMSAAAQETYQDTKLAASQLTGTARYVGMGGAMEALGADISTISTNPAGVGLFRKNRSASLLVSSPRAVLITAFPLANMPSISTARRVIQPSIR